MVTMLRLPSAPPKAAAYLNHYFNVYCRARHDCRDEYNTLSQEEAPARSIGRHIYGNEESGGFSSRPVTHRHQ